MAGKTSRVDFENGRILQNILGTALPMLAAQVLTLLYNIVDRIYIGRLPEIGTAALGAVGLCFPIVILVTAFTNMCGMGGSPLFSMEMGRKNKEKAAEILNTSFRLLILFAILLTVFAELFASPVLRLFGAGDSQLSYALPYLRIYMLGTLFSMISTGMNSFINAQGYSMTGMLSVVIGAAANIVLDPIFMFALHLGVAGAAIATVISQALSFLFVLRFLLGKRNACPLQKPASGGKLLPHAGNILVLGLSPFIMQVTNALVSITCNSVLMRFGGEMYVSVMTIISSVRQVVDTPAMAITEGASPVISYNYGARRPVNVRKAIFLMSVLAIGYTLLMWLFIEWQPALLAGIFTDNAELQELCLEPLHLYFLAFIFQSFQFCGQTVFKSLGKEKKAIFFSLLRKVILVVPLTYLLPYVFSQVTNGVFLAEPISNLIGGCACLLTMLLTVMPELKRMECR